MEKNQIVKVDDVFSTTIDRSINYVNRHYVDDVLFEELSQDNHVVLYGGSKQGKSWLKMKHLCSSPSDSIYCTSSFDLERLHKAIVRHLSPTQIKEEVESLSEGSSECVQSSIGAKALVKGEVKGEKSKSKGASNSITRSHADIDWLNINQVADVVKEHTERDYIVLEEFHLLPRRTQQEFAQELKAFQERVGIIFIIIGVWIEDDRIQRLASDINLRVKSINVGHWEKADLERVATQGADILNIDLPPGFPSSVAKSCFGNVALAQKVCLKACQHSGVTRKRSKVQKLRIDFNVPGTVRQIAKDFSSTDSWIIGLLESSGEQGRNARLREACLKSILHFTAKNWARGIDLEKVMRMFQSYCDREMRGHISFARDFFESIESAQKIANGPIYFEYDRKSRRLHCVETGYLIWRMQKKRGSVIQIVDDKLEDPPESHRT